jgi:hypothetical protein
MQYTIGSFVLIATVTMTLGGAAHLYMGGTDGETTGRIATALGAEGPAIAGGDEGGDDADDIGFDLSAAADMLPGFEPESVLAVAGLPGIPGIPKLGKKGDSPFGALPVSKREKKDKRDRDLPPGDKPRGDPDDPNDPNNPNNDPNDPNCTGTSCNKPGKQCFGAGTLVVTADGLLPIETLALGDLVLTRSTEDQPLVARAVTAVHETPGKPILEIWIQEHGAAPELIEVTPRHPFWVAGEGWVDSDQLAPGDQLSTADGDAASVVAIASTARTETVYNLTVDEHHTYFVGTSETWVHNVGNCGEDRDQRTTMNSKNCPMADYNPGAGFSGALNTETGEWVAVASGNATLKNPDPDDPITTVSQFGGHREAEANLPSGRSRKNVGFVVVYTADGEAEIRWNSRTINERNFGAGRSDAEKRSAPEEYREQVRDAIKKACGGMNIKG